MMPQRNEISKFITEVIWKIKKSFHEGQKYNLMFSYSVLINC